LVIAVIRTDFPRLTTEINLGVSLWDVVGSGADAVGAPLVGADRVGGLPSNTRRLQPNIDGWVRYEWEFVTTPSIARGMPVFQQYVGNRTAMPQLELAELVVVETTVEALKPLPGAEGLTFKGSAGSLQMSVLECTVSGAVTIAANYTFANNGTVQAWQNIDVPRQVAEWRLSVPLIDLKVLSFVPGSAGRCIVGNSAISIGVQIDGLLGFVPQIDAVATLVNMFGGDFNRIHDGHLLSEDDFGGLTVTPAIPAGSGRLARWSMVTEGLAFPVLNATDTNTKEELAPGWSVAWKLSAGERLFSSVMPNRPYEWDASFDFMWFTCGSDTLCREYAKFTPQSNRLLGNVTAYVMWHTAAKEYGSSSPGPYEPYPNASEAQRTIDALHASGKAALPYMSAFYHSTRNASEYIGHVKEWKDRFRIDGIYSDGLPEYDWLCAYEEVRMLRELFPSGPLIFHDTMHRPVAEFRAFLHTYATALYMGEGVKSNAGIDWSWPKAATAQYRRSNSFGALDMEPAWYGPGINLSSTRDSQDLVPLLYNGRQCPDSSTTDGLAGFISNYLPALEKLKEVWLEHGKGKNNTASFYDQFYLPAAQNITGLMLGRSPMPIATPATMAAVTGIVVQLYTFGGDVPMRYTLDGSAPSDNGILYSDAKALSIPRGGHLRAISERIGLAPSRELSVKGAPGLKTDDIKSTVPAVTAKKTHTAGPPRAPPMPITTDERSATALNWSHFAHFSWRARVTGISDGRPIPNTTWFDIAGNTTGANGSAWTSPMTFNNASIARVAGSYTNKVLLAGKGSYDALAADTFDFLNFALSAGDDRKQPRSWGHWNETLSVDLELEVTFESGGGPSVHRATAWRGGTCSNDCEPGIGLLLGREAGTPQIFTFREYNQHKYWRHFETLPELKKFPKKILLMDSFCSDTEVGSWQDGITNLRKLGLRAIDICPGNPVGAAIQSQIRMITKNVTGEQITSGGSFGPLSTGGDDWAPKGSVTALYAHNRTAQLAVEAKGVASFLEAGYVKTDVTLANMADEPYLGGGLGGGLGPLPPIGNQSFPRATEWWHRFLRGQGLVPADFGVSSWEKVMPSGMPAGAAPSRVERARYYWTLRFMAWFPTLEYAEATKMSREAFHEDIYTYANTNNFGSRFFYPGRFDNESLLAFDWFEMGRNNATSLLWCAHDFDTVHSMFLRS
jgi:hypothetical protein